MDINTILMIITVILILIASYIAFVLIPKQKK